MPRRLTCSLVFLAVLLAPAGADAQDLTGSWCGRWEDCRSGHSGPLKGVFCKCGEDAYQVVFTGRYFGVLPFRFKTTLRVVEQDGATTRLSGESRVGLFGVFSYDAVANATNFDASFQSRRYDGRFTLTR